VGLNALELYHLNVAFLSIFSVFEVILGDMKPRGCANHEEAHVLGSCVSLPKI
jgi:hypothetical protein